MYYKPNEIDEAQSKLNLEKENFDKSLDEEHQKKIKAIGEAFKLFKEANLPVFMFAEHEASNSKGEKVMVQYNNLREISLLRSGDVEIPRLTKKFARSVCNFICSFIDMFLKQREITAPIKSYPSLFFELYDILDVSDMETLCKSERFFEKSLRGYMNANNN